MSEAKNKYPSFGEAKKEAYKVLTYLGSFDVNPTRCVEVIFAIDCIELHISLENWDDDDTMNMNAIAFKNATEIVLGRNDLWVTFEFKPKEAPDE